MSVFVDRLDEMDRLVLGIKKGQSLGSPGVPSMADLLYSIYVRLMLIDGRLTSLEMTMKELPS